MYGYQDGFHMMGWSWIILLVAVAAMVYVVKGRGECGKKEKSAQDILDERYAKGEIDLQEYRERSQEIKRP